MQLCQGIPLSQENAYTQFSYFLKGSLNTIEMSALLSAIKAKGEAPDEIMGVLKVMREAAIAFPNGELLIVLAQGEMDSKRLIFHSPGTFDVIEK